MIIRESVGIILSAAKETPRLYFAPLVAMFRAARGLQRLMVEAQRKH